MALITRQFSDLNFMFTPHPVKRDVSLLYNQEDIKESIKNLVLTKNYDRPFHPEIGCAATAMLFENATIFTTLTVKRTIQDVIANFEPRVQVVDITVDFIPVENYFSVNIIFLIQNNPQPITMGVILERTR